MALGHITTNGTDFYVRETSGDRLMDAFGEAARTAARMGQECKVHHLNVEVVVAVDATAGSLNQAFLQALTARMPRR